MRFWKKDDKNKRKKIMYRKDKKREFFTIKARAEGYPARSVYKLQEIDEKFNLFKRGDKVLDLGCAPGSWLLYILKKIGERGKVVGADIEDIKIPEQKNLLFIKKDILEFKDDELEEKFNVVVSDAAPSTSGMRDSDAEKSLELSKKALEIAQKVLYPRGNFLCKIFEGESTEEFFKKVKQNFKLTKRFRPKATPKGSRESYVVAKDFLQPLDYF